MLFIAAIVITFSVAGYSRTYMKYNISAIFTNGDKTDSSSQLQAIHINRASYSPTNSACKPCFCAALTNTIDSIFAGRYSISIRCGFSS
jgi:hypothetical protein